MFLLAVRLRRGLSSGARVFDQDSFYVVQEPIEGGRGNGAITVKDSGPLFESFVGGDDDRITFVALADNFEQQVSAVAVGRNYEQSGIRQRLTRTKRDFHRWASDMADGANTSCLCIIRDYRERLVDRVAV
jgi:hypothetical protein